MRGIICIDGKPIKCEAIVKCPNRYMDGVDYVYIETLDEYESPKLQSYHQWRVDEGVLYAYLIKKTDIGE